LTSLRKSLAVAAFLLAAAWVPVAAQRAPPRVILFIGDGTGVGAWTAARVSADALAVERLPVGGLVDAREGSGKITDSAASATALAAGIHTFNGAISVGPDSQPVRTVLELAEARGMATGLVATSSITHATPAAFAAHVPSRSQQFEIARQMAGQGIDVLLGGGRRYFLPMVRPDSVDLVGELRRHSTVVESAEALGSLGMDTVRTLVGLFADDGMPPAAERTPTLAQMTAAALAILDRDPNGFFLMVEGSQPDWREHENDSLAAVAAEVLDLDRAVAVALDYCARRPETLVIVTADHETGGLAVVEDSTGAFAAAYVGGDHTATLVPLFAGGPGAERFGGLRSIDNVGRALQEYVTRAKVGDTAR
jgi:alkaline phosphatase